MKKRMSKVTANFFFINGERRGEMVGGEGGGERGSERDMGRRWEKRRRRSKGRWWREKETTKRVKIMYTFIYIGLRDLLCSVKGVAHL